MSRKPVVFDLEDSKTVPSVADAPPVPEPQTAPEQEAAADAGRRSLQGGSGLGRWFWSVLLGLVGTLVSLAAWDYATTLIARIPLLGWAVAAAIVVLLGLALVFGLRELAALSRLRRTDGLRQRAEGGRKDLDRARRVVSDLDRFYAPRKDLAWARARLSERRAEVLDADALLDQAEDILLTSLDRQAQAEVEQAARQVAAVTALVPLALADVVAALLSSLRMIRRIAEIYGGRSGFFSSWRLTRAVFTHLVATGAMAVGDDLLEPILGGSVLSKLSRRFGEGLVNGALTARVGLAAMEVCRPLPFSARAKPSTRKVIQNALTGLVSRDSGPKN
ncbi:hypothetical protein TRM7557_00487 [Tritonibacter multivorans]|uniref:TIGR01620 family protein n=1 Tax=Tritonibacter multivorans TaxID=928856 RepID=A0A0P1G228_9RHOB|nr:TIGR01620 family protein [Tritonibacter multivorans]MDA7419525.1 TIGR01620 family protein [Tritonibacter multivorans]CUH75636.1 hypothetical protein TRM7557_00487 [Tritonibacter multivorans]SFC63795.1 putative membrane protein [Tritonibacter multivorans]